MLTDLRVKSPNFRKMIQGVMRNAHAIKAWAFVT